MVTSVRPSRQLLPFLLYPCCPCPASLLMALLLGRATLPFPPCLPPSPPHAGAHSSPPAPSCGPSHGPSHAGPRTPRIRPPRNASWQQQQEQMGARQRSKAKRGGLTALTALGGRSCPYRWYAAFQLTTHLFLPVSPPYVTSGTTILPWQSSALKAIINVLGGSTLALFRKGAAYFFRPVDSLLWLVVESGTPPFLPLPAPSPFIRCAMWRRRATSDTWTLCSC